MMIDDTIQPMDPWLPGRSKNNRDFRVAVIGRLNIVDY